MPCLPRDSEQKSMHKTFYLIRSIFYGDDKREKFND
jgi:hypothetical protein